MLRNTETSFGTRGCGIPCVFLGSDNHGNDTYTAFYLAEALELQIFESLTWLLC